METYAGLGRRRVGALRISAAVVGVPLLVAAIAIGARSLRGVVSPSAGGPASVKLTGEATWPAGVRPAPPIAALHDQRGQPFSLGALRGRTVAMVFFDSHCRQECPLAGRALAGAERSLPPAQRPVLVVVSVNPLDTAASTRAAARSWGLSGLAPWHWLRGTHSELARVWRAYRIYVQPERGDIAHTEALYLIDRRGDERSGFLYPYLPDRVTHDLRVLAGAGDRTRAGGGRA
jgi:protein SCO1